MEGRICALVPAYEPDETLPALCQQLFSAGYAIVIVDDGSGPVYAPVFAKAAMYGCVLKHATNLGKGAALKTGLRYLAEVADAEDVVVTVDADGQHKIMDICKVASRAQREGTVLVLGSRTLRSGTPLRSRVGNALTRAAFQMLSRLAVSDTQTGLRAFPYGMIAFLLEIPGDRYEYEMNMLLACAKYGVPIVEEPIEAVYLEENASSHFRTFADAARIFREMLSFSASSFISFCIDYALFALFTLIFATQSGAILQISNVLARVFSASFNFAINRRFVFCAQAEKLFPAAVRYFLLAMAVLAMNTLILTGLVQYCGIYPYFAKLLTEAALFLCSWSLQKWFVFRKSGAARPECQNGGENTPSL